MPVRIVKFDNSLRVTSTTVFRKKAFMYDWAIADASKADMTLLKTTPEVAYAFLDESIELVLFGRAKNDYRADEYFGNFLDGHRIITSQIIEANSAGICTENTHYTLGEVSIKYAEWCKNNGKNLTAALE
jgi:hypothetical protein